MRDVSNRLYGIIFAAYVGSGPIYWIPGVSVEAINIVKYALFSMIILWPVFRGGGSYFFGFPGGKAVLSLFAVFFFLSIFGMLNGELGASIYKLQNTIQIFLFLMSCGFLIKSEMIHFVALNSVRIFIFFSILSLALMLIMPEYTNPLTDEFHGYQLTDTGLGGSRTGWSPAVALYLPWVYAGFMALPGYWVLVAALSMVANQVLVGGRTGMASALVAFVFYGVFRKNIKVFLLVAIATVIVGVLAMSNREALRIESDGMSNGIDWNELSSNRTDDYIGALNEIANNPFVGVGVGEGIFQEVHNVLLKCALEGGIPYALSLVGLFVVALLRGWRGLDSKDWFVVSALLTVLSGIINSFFEPVAMLGSFNNAPFWWLCFAICVNAGRSKKYRKFVAVQAEKHLWAIGKVQ